MIGVGIVVVVLYICIRHFVSGGQGGLAPSPMAELNYGAVCEVVGEREVYGWVTNNSSDVYQVNGSVHFTIETPGVINRQNADLFATVFIPAQQRVRVAQKNLASVIKKSDTCRFDVAQAIRKL